MKLNKEQIENVAVKKYTSESTMTAVDPSLLWEKLVSGNRRPKLSFKIPSKAKLYYEYGYDSYGKCIYRKKIDTDNIYNSGIDICYVHEGTSIYEIPSNIYDVPYCEYHFDEHGRIVEIPGRERYEWLDESIAIVSDLERQGEKWLLLKENDELVALFELKKDRWQEEIPSLVTGNVIDLNNYSCREKVKLQHSKVNGFYAQIKDKQNKVTEFYEITLLDKVYVGSYFYIKIPQGFSYANAKLIYKNEVMNFINQLIENAQQKIHRIDIQYFGGGYSILDINVSITFNEDGCHKTNEIMQEIVFSSTNMEQLNFLDTYMNDNMYYDVHRKMIKDIKRKLEETHGVKVVLEEITD